MKSSKPTISFFCPAYNDEGNLPLLIPAAIKTLRQVSSKFEIVIVEDGSPDRTAEVADKLAKKYKPFIKVIHHKKNKGYGEALRKGFKEAKKYDYVFYTDGDNQYDVTELKKLIPFLKSYDVVAGYRRKRLLSRQRLIQTNIYNFVIRVFFNVQVRDINCSMKIIKRNFLDKIKLQSRSSFIDAELLIRLRSKGARLKEVPVSHRLRLHGEASGGKPAVVIATLNEMYAFWKTSRFI